MQAYKYSSIPQCVVDTYKNEGTAGFFRGIVPPPVVPDANLPLSLPPLPPRSPGPDDSPVVRRHVNPPRNNNPRANNLLLHLRSL
jgi:hypothetical protein